MNLSDSDGLAGKKKIAEAIASGIQKVNGRMPKNWRLAGKKHPKTGVPFKADGYPDFSDYAKKTVDVAQTGNRTLDDAAANLKAGFDKGTPDGYTWHHVEDGKTMQLVPEDIHTLTGHSGGVAGILEKTGAIIVFIGTILDFTDPFSWITSGDMEPPPGYREGPFGTWIKDGGCK